MKQKKVVISTVRKSDIKAEEKWRENFFQNTSYILPKAGTKPLAKGRQGVEAKNRAKPGYKNSHKSPLTLNLLFP